MSSAQQAFEENSSVTVTLLLAYAGGMAMLPTP